MNYIQLILLQMSKFAIYDDSGKVICYTDYHQYFQKGGPQFINDDGSPYGPLAQPGSLNIFAARLVKTEDKTVADGGNDNEAADETDDHYDMNDSGDNDDEKLSQTKRVTKGVNKSGNNSDNKCVKGGKKQRAKKKVETVMGYQLVEEKRDDGKRKRVETMAKTAESIGYNMVDFDLMTEKELDADYEIRTKTSLSQEFMGTGKGGIACAQCGAGEYRRNKGGGVCKVCSVDVKSSKAVYQCTGIGCDEQRCLDCYNSLR